MEYILIKKSNVQDFNFEIKEKLNDGWEIHGEQFTYKVFETTVHTQAMIKKDVDLPSIEQIMASWNVG